VPINGQKNVISWKNVKVEEQFPIVCAGISDGNEKK
jgi:hypothetical protein